MTDYPTRAEIDAAADTLGRLFNEVDTATSLATIARDALWNAVRVLGALDDVPGLHLPAPDPQPEPEPEPKPTAAQVLFQASTRQNDNSPEGSILWAAHRYAKDHPEWFVNWHEYDWTQGALANAAFYAGGHGQDPIAEAALVAASEVAKAHPELFGGAS